MELRDGPEVGGGGREGGLGPESLGCLGEVVGVYRTGCGGGAVD